MPTRALLGLTINSREKLTEVTRVELALFLRQPVLAQPGVLAREREGLLAELVAETDWKGKKKGDVGP